jgi:serine phosphatase RsbU (regulator of sigma subunit)
MATLERLHRLTTRLWPEAGRSPDVEKQAMMIVAITLVNLPLVTAAVVWQIAATNWGVWQQQWPLFGVLLVASILLSRQRYQILVKIPGQSRRLPVTNSLVGVLGWTLVLIFGPTAIWLLWLANLLLTLEELRQARRRESPWAVRLLLSSLAQTFGPYTLTFLISAAVYGAAGGVFPLSSPNPADWLPALLATATLLIVPSLLYLPTFLVINVISGLPNNAANLGRLASGTFLFSLFSTPFAVPLALTYALGDWPLFLAIVAGLILVNWLAYYLSQATMRSQVRADGLALLEQLGQAIIKGPADASNLEAILAEHVPQLFTGRSWEIRLFPPAADEPTPAWSHFSLQHGEDNGVAPPADWPQLRQTSAAYLIQPAPGRPAAHSATGQVIMVKITDQAGAGERLLGGISLLRGSGSVLHTEDVVRLMQDLASQIGAALYRAQTHAGTMAHQKMVQELEFAGRIQSTFLPAQVPALAGWDISATLIAARQTSGDFYDFVPLPEGRLGLIVADVADKGTGAALYMALSRTLIRTYALEYPDEPERALQAANERILADTQSDQFVTVFYGILLPENGLLTYANAGHNPACIVGVKEQLLGQTGIPLGMFPAMAWQRRQAQLRPGDVLVMYTDGFCEAQDSNQAEFGEARLLEIVRAYRDRGATAVQQALIDGVSEFIGDAPQFDDLTLLVAGRAT